MRATDSLRSRTSSSSRAEPNGTARRQGASSSWRARPVSFSGRRCLDSRAGAATSSLDDADGALDRRCRLAKGAREGRPKRDRSVATCTNPAHAREDPGDDARRDRGLAGKHRAVERPWPASVVACERWGPRVRGTACEGDRTRSDQKETDRSQTGRSRARQRRLRAPTRGGKETDRSQTGRSLARQDASGRRRVAPSPEKRPIGRNAPFPALRAPSTPASLAERAPRRAQGCRDFNARIASAR